MTWAKSLSKKFVSAPQVTVGAWSSLSASESGARFTGRKSIFKTKTINFGVKIRIEKVNGLCVDL